MKGNIKIFDAFKTNCAGVWFFVPYGEFKKGKPCKGFGSIKYNEGSVYTGDVFYDGKNFEKLGYGQQDFTRSTIGVIDADINERKYKFAGKFDYRKTDWIYGNGVLYYTDADGNPSHFVKGFFSGLGKIADYKGEFDYSALLDGYTADMEFDYDFCTAHSALIFDKAYKKCENAECVDVLFIGDSYFELMNNPEFCGVNSFEDGFPATYVNAGIGGSTFTDWHAYIDRLSGLKQPKKIIINLGFNDLHTGKSVEKVYNDYLILLKMIKKLFPKAEIYLIRVVHAPAFPEYTEKENELNTLTLKTSEKLGTVVGDWNGLIEGSREYCFHADGVHPNECGYALFAKFIKELLSL